MVKKSLRMKAGIYEKKYKIDIDQEWDQEISNTEELLDEFYVREANRISAAEKKIKELEPKSDHIKHEIYKSIDKERKEIY
jgi:uncharacterized protein Yka (UPF0111/DUF47 family)